MAYCKYCKSHLFFNSPHQNGWFLGSFVSFGCEIESDEEWLNGMAVLTCLSPTHTSVTAAICVHRNTSYVDNPTFLPNVSFIGLFTRRNPCGVCNSDMLYMSPALDYVWIVYKATTKQFICRQDCRFDWSTWSCLLLPFYSGLSFQYFSSRYAYKVTFCVLYFSVSFVN